MIGVETDWDDHANHGLPRSNWQNAPFQMQWTFTSMWAARELGKQAGRPPLLTLGWSAGLSVPTQGQFGYGVFTVGW